MVRTDIDTHLGALAVLIRRAAGVDGKGPCDRKKSAVMAVPVSQMPIVPRALTRC